MSFLAGDTSLWATPVVFTQLCLVRLDFWAMVCFGKWSLVAWSVCGGVGVSGRSGWLAGSV